MIRGKREIKTVLWDADGVLQHPKDGWQQQLVALGGPDFPQACFDAEGPAALGETTFVAAIVQLLQDRGLTVPLIDVLNVWTQIDLDREAIDLVNEVRHHQARSVLATNQQDHRIAYMRTIGYKDWCDHLYVSCEMGVAKPSVDYFQHILDAEGIAAHQAIFFDDNEANVAAAAQLGIHAYHHAPTAGAASLRTILVDHRVLSG